MSNFGIVSKRFMNRRERQKAETHLEILRAAEDLFIEVGYEKASMRQIAERAGLTKGALYHHFDSKEDLLDKLCAEHNRALSEAASSLVNDTSFSCFKRMRRVMEMSRDMGMSHLAFVSEYLTNAYDAGKIMLKEKLYRYDKQFFVTFMGPLLKEAKEKGECDFASTPDMLAFFLYQMDRGVDEEIRRIFGEENRDNGKKLIVNILKTYVYALSRILNAAPEKISALISLEETVHFYGEILKRK
ncbi:MAG: TetR/AcrR family transcriptional regulator [Treponema sp.]|jgi:AcrR family transcriptional regulator|nr:TetR/AcrR family transcriptional regulator [Treponema sp.]